KSARTIRCWYFSTAEVMHQLWSAMTAAGWPTAITATPVLPCIKHRATFTATTVVINGQCRAAVLLVTAASFILWDRVQNEVSRHCNRRFHTPVFYASIAIRPAHATPWISY